MSRGILCFALLLSFCTLFAAPEKTKGKTDRIPFTFVDEFESGELNAWETYPFAEDPGFDPNIVCVSEPARTDSRFSLASIFKPNDTDYPRDQNLVGMTKKCRIRTAPTSVFQLSVFLETDRKAEEFRIILAAEDGQPYVYSMASPPAGRWFQVRCTLEDFFSGGKALPPGTRIDAVAVLARYGPVNPHRSYVVCIDDVSFSGETDRRFVSQTPSSTYLDRFYFAFLNRHFFRGENFFLHCFPGNDIPVRSWRRVSCTVTDSRGCRRAVDVPLYDDGSHGDRKSKDGVWGNDSVYRIGRSAPPGRWQVDVQGASADGRTVRDRFYFLVLVRRLSPADHPRLFYSGADRKNLDPKRKGALALDAYERSVAAAKRSIAQANVADVTEDSDINLEFLDGGYVSNTWNDYYRWYRPGALAQQWITDGAFLYSLAGDRDAGLKAKEIMLQFSRFRSWNHPWFTAHRMYTYYPPGFWCQAMAIGYDLLYPLLSPEERSEVHRAILEKGIIPAYRDHVELNQLPSQITNHIGVTTSGMVMAALAILGEEPENPDVEPYLSGLLAKMKAHIDAGYLSDGSYAESMGYYHMDSESLAKALDAIERIIGIDYTNSTGMKSAYFYPIYASTASGRDCLDFGDGGRNWEPDGRRMNLWLANRNGDRIAWDRYRWQMDSGSSSLPPDFFDFFWLPGPLARMPVSELPTSRWFPVKGNAVFRSGWAENDLIFNFRCGPHSNHSHFDQGSFRLRYNNEDLISEAGLVNYYQNHYYRPFYIQAVGHNVLLLNDYPESQAVADFHNEIGALGAHPAITACSTGEIIDALESEISAVYKGRLSRFARSFVFVKPDYLVLFDDIVAARQEKFTWMFHGEGGNSIRAEGACLRVIRPKAELRMDVLQPEGISYSLKPYPDRDACFIAVRAPGSSRSVRFLSVLVPMSAENRQEREGWKSARIEEGNWLGAEVRRGNDVDTVLFQTASGRGVESVQRWSTDADRFAVTIAGGRAMKKFWVRNATVFRENRPGGEVFFQSTNRISAAVDYGQTESRAEVDLSSRSQLMFRMEERPGKVLRNGGKIGFSFNQAAKRLTVSLPTGKSDLRIVRE